MIPNNWDDITIEGYVAFNKSLKETASTNTDIVELQIKRVCYLTGCEPEEAEKLTTEEYAKVNELIKTPMPSLIRKRFKVCGKSYRFKLLSGPRTGGEYAAIMNTIKGDGGLDAKLDNLHHIMFLISEPIKFGFRKKFPFVGWKPYQFEGRDIPDRIQDFKQMKLKYANPAAVFFSKVSKELTSLLGDYSISALKEMTVQMKELEADLNEHMDGL